MRSAASGNRCRPGCKLSALRTACCRYPHCTALVRLFRNRREQQGSIETEIGQTRNRCHFHLLDCPIGFQRERHERIGQGSLSVYSAESWEELLLPEIERQQELGKEVVVRADAAFAKPEAYEALEERGVKYAIRIPANDSLERDIAELLPRPVGRPSIKPLIEYKSFLYQAASWGRARRVVAKVEHHRGELSNTEEATGCIVVATRSQNGNLAFGVRLVSLKSRDAALSSTAR